ncbi:MAG: PASTA domain-containing protein [Bacteroidales bacterium]|nr:PASTA domain-containing protein [Bacteroidales bacterium]
MDFKSFAKEHPVWADILQGVLLSLLIVAAVMLLLRWFTRHGKEYEVPDMCGKSFAEVEQFQHDGNRHHFRFLVNDSVFVPDVEGGTVMSQDPAPGQLVKRGRKIYLSVSTLNPPQVEMPNLIDLSLRQAENLLKTNDLKLGQVVYKPSRFVNAVLEQRYKGRVIRPGTRLPYHAEITLVVGKESGSEEESSDWQ